MPKKSTFVVVGENIHCSRVYKTRGLHVKETGGAYAIVYQEEGAARSLPIPPCFTETDEWKRGNVKHAAAAIWQGIHGADREARQAGRDYLAYLARRQQAAGASFLDLNVDEFSVDVGERSQAIQWLAHVVQSASAVPLSIDSSNLEILRAGLAACDRSRGKPMVNSVSLERLAAIGIAAETGAVVVASAAGEAEMPASTEERLRNLEQLLPRLFSAGLKHEDVFLDPLVFPISVNPQNGLAVLESVAQLRARYGEAIHFAPGLSNISYGMPNRKLLNQVFAWLCRQQGLDGGIVDPLQINEETLAQLDPQSEPFMLARDVLEGKDEFALKYIAAFRQGRI